MKIAFFHELHAGGARRSVNELAKRLKQNHVVDVYLVGRETAKDEKKFFTNVFFYKFFPKKWTGGNWKVKLYKDTIELYKLYKLHKKIAEEINKKIYDVAFIHPSQFTQAPFLLRFIKIRKVYYCQEPLRMAYESEFAVASDISMQKRIYEKTIRWIRKKIDNENIKHANLILANSKHTQKNIISAYGLESIVSYLGVDTDTFKPSHVKKEIDVLFIGAKDKTDGYDLLESALRKIKNKSVLKIHSMGEDWISNDKDFVKLYGRSKVVVCLTRHEPFGLIPLEAMACGVPVVAVAEGGYNESIIDGKTGYLVERNPKKLKEAISKLLINDRLRIKIGKAAREHIEKNWTWDKNIKNFLKIIKSAK